MVSHFLMTINSFILVTANNIGVINITNGQLGNPEYLQDAAKNMSLNNSYHVP